MSQSPPSDPPQLGPGPWRVVFMGTPDFALPSLAGLAETQEVVGVFTQPDRPAGRGRRLQPSPVKVLAEERGLPVFQPRSFKRDPEALETLRALEPQLLVVAAYGLILPQSVLDVAPGGAINVHASLLPRWRGAAPVAHAILAGDTETGVTIMRMEAGLDTGPMLSHQAIPILPDSRGGPLTASLAELGAELLLRTLPDWMQGRIQAEVQDEAASTYAPRLKKSDGRLDWSESALALDRRVRAMSPWPGAFTEWKGQRLKILSSRPLEQAPEPRPGAAELPTKADQRPGLVVDGTVGPAVVTGQGWLQLERLQAPGGKALAAADFARGRQGFLGATLGQVTEGSRA